MRRRRSRGAWLVLAFLLCVAGEPRVAAAGEAWAERTQLVWDKETKRVVRRTFQVFDPHPDRKLEFLWEPLGKIPDGTGPVRAEGPGTLSWHVPDAPTYDRRYTFSVFKGTLKDGRAEGEGWLETREGFSYRGGWTAGLMQGRGRLRLENGDRYDGQFRSGLMEGDGIYVAADGTTYRGSFVAGVRDGAGLLTDATGSYLTVWRGGREVERKPETPVRGQLKPTLAAAADGLKLTLMLDQTKTRDFLDASPDGAGYSYDLEAKPDAIDIRLGAPGVLAYWKGNQGVVSAKSDSSPIVSPAQFAPLFLAGRLENGGSAPIQIAEAYVEVVASSLDQTPLLQIRMKSEDSCATPLDHDLSFVFRNLGWGAVRNARVTYSIGTKTDRSTPVSASLGSFAFDKTISMREYFRQLGFDLRRMDAEARLMRAIEDRKTSRESLCTRNVEYEEDGGKGDDAAPPKMKPDPQFEACARAAANKAFGPLAKYVFHPEEDVTLYTTVSGRIEYVSAGIGNQEVSRDSAFSIDVPLMDMAYQGAAELGCPDFTTPQVKAVTLSTDRQNYRIPLPKEWKARIDPGRSLTVGVTMTAPKSSEHRFRLVLKAKDGSQITTPEVSLSFFRPRFTAK